MTVSIDSFGASLIHYRDKVIELASMGMLASEFAKGGELQWEGEKAVTYVHTTHSTAFGWTTDGAAIPPSKQQGYAPAEVYRKMMVGKVSITDGMLANAKTSKGAAVAVLKSELRGLIESIKKMYNFSWTRDGTGVVALLGATTSGATFTVTDARGLWEGCDCSIHDSAAPGTIHDTFTVASISPSYDNELGEATITPTAALAASGQAQGDLIVWGAGAFDTYGKAITGLDAGIDDGTGTFQGISGTTYPRYRSIVLDNGGTPRPLEPGLLRLAMAACVQVSGDKNPELVALGSTWGSIPWDELYESAVRMTPDDDVAGVSTPTFQSSLARVKVVNDPDAPYGKQFWLRPEEITLGYQQKLDWRPATDGGGGIMKRDDDNLKYTATCYEMSELFYDRRNIMLKIEDLEENVQIAY